jgi:NTP pyrophosphatase (non-canonical NTP hydrolase)
MSDRIGEVCKRAIERYGESDQLDLAKEECAELIVALSHYQRGRCRMREVVDEVADVTIMLEQVLQALGPEARGLARARVAAKLDRLEKRMCEEKR